MEHKVIKKDTWHYKLLMMTHNKDHHLIPKNHCAYLASVVISLFLFVAVSVFFAGVSFFILALPLGNFLGWVAAMIVNGALIEVNDLGTVAFLIYIFVGLAFLLTQSFFFLTDKLKKSYMNRPPEQYKEPGAIKQYYRAYKDKYCIPLKFED